MVLAMYQTAYETWRNDPQVGYLQPLQDSDGTLLVTALPNYSFYLAPIAGVLVVDANGTLLQNHVSYRISNSLLTIFSQIRRPIWITV